MMWTYVGVVAFLVLFFTSRTSCCATRRTTASPRSPIRSASARSDASRKYWTAAERNTQLPPIAGLMLCNRLIWLGVARGAVRDRLLRVPLRGQGQPDRRSRAMAQAVAVRPPAPAINAARRPRTRPARARAGDSSWPSRASTCAFVFKSPAFFVLLAIGSVQRVRRACSGRVELRGTEYFPVTRASWSTR